MGDPRAVGAQAEFWWPDVDATDASAALIGENHGKYGAKVQSRGLSDIVMGGLKISRNMHIVLGWGHSMMGLMAGSGVLPRLHPLCSPWTAADGAGMCWPAELAPITVINWE